MSLLYLVLSLTLTVSTVPYSASALPQGLANFLLSLRGAPIGPPALSDLSRFRSFSCTNRKDGTYPDTQSGCVTYYRCLGGSVFSYMCPDGTKFDQDKGDCLPSQNVTCTPEPQATRKCHAQSDGFYPDYTTSCRSYYRCKEDMLVGTGQCERGSMWDYSTSSCWSGQRASCSPPSCFGLPDGAHLMPGSRCAAYFTCKEGSRTDHLCPLGTSFDYMEKECVANSRSVCYERVCEGRVNGIHAMPNAPCEAYFRCFNAALVEVEMCPPRHIFDGYECIQAANFSCWSDSNGSCSDRPDGVYAADDRECRGFFLCRQNILVRSFRCSSGLVFNGEKCVDSQNYICSSRPRLPDCTNKHDGYYILEKSECRSFYHCRNGAKLSEHNCPGNFVFNGKQCVDPLLHTCRSNDVALSNHSRRTRFTRKTDDCSKSSDGFHINLTKGCSSFYKCQAGVKVSTHSCPTGTLFSGSRCVSTEYYKCPVEPLSKYCRLGDGNFFDRSEPQSYFRCSAGLKTSFKCPEGMIFNGWKCVSRRLLDYQSTPQLLWLQKIASQSGRSRYFERRKNRPSNSLDN